MKGLKRSVKIKQEKDNQKFVKEIKDVVKQASINYGFLSSLLVEGDPEATYHNIMDFRESVDKMVEGFNEINKKGSTN